VELISRTWIRFKGGRIMSLTRCCIGVVLSGLMVVSASGADEAKDKPNKEEIKKAEEAVKDRLKEMKGEAAMVAHLEDETLGRVFPDHHFFSVAFRQYPVARANPEGLQSCNVFVVLPKGKLKLLTETKELEAFAKETFGKVKEEKAAKEAALAYLQLAQQFQLDGGFIAFKTAKDAAKVEKDKIGLTATAESSVAKGGNGDFKIALVFDYEDGKLIKITETSEIKPGPRPICHATLLLDANPLVRRIVEQDLFIMGRAAKYYLDEQRAKANPDLQKAIDRMWQRILDNEEKR
jgi:hypothetical protein